MSVYNNATNTPKLTAAGQLFIGSSAGNPVAATLTPGANVTITNSNGAIQIASALSPPLQINQVSLQFTTPGTYSYTPTAGTLYVFVQVLGGGGGGGGTTNSGAVDVIAGSGGGGGGYTEAFIPIATVGAGQTVTVGVGGNGVSSADGVSGGPSSFGLLLIGNEGIGGTLGVAELGFVTGGNGGGATGTSFIYSYDGQTGGSSGPPSGPLSADIPPYAYAGDGASCFTGRVNRGYAWSPPIGAVNSPGIPAVEFGVGGSGGFSAISSAPTAGGDGGPGFVFITEYIGT